ncbi:hypothetical protein DSUL_100015 [Desulfovibrionales bacterium]
MGENMKIPHIIYSSIGISGSGIQRILHQYPPAKKNNVVLFTTLLTVG